MTCECITYRGYEACQEPEKHGDQVEPLPQPITVAQWAVGVTVEDYKYTLPRPAPKAAKQLFGPKLQHNDFMGVHLCAAMPDQLPDRAMVEQCLRMPGYPMTTPPGMKPCDACGEVFRRIMRQPAAEPTSASTTPAAAKASPHE